ncbi:MAG: cupin domain-containing protein [Gammaproteobacteria bacterium]|nr:cupin domain-containing protein [Gammaproteobacteria bacterium]
MSIINRKNAEHYRWGGNCDAWHLLKTRRMSVVEERVPRGGAEKAHYHRYSTQLFYLLAGSVRFSLGAEILNLQPGDAVHVSPGVIHMLENTGDTDAVLLVMSNPESHSDRYDVHPKPAPPASP